MKDQILLIYRNQYGTVDEGSFHTVRQDQDTDSGKTLFVFEDSAMPEEPLVLTKEDIVAIIPQ